MSRPKAILFDLDGVLVHSIEAWYRMLVSAARHFGRPHITRESFDAGWGQGIDADLQTFFQGCRAEEIERYYATHLLDHAEAIEVTEDAASTVARLQQLGIPCVLITNTPTGLARDILAWADLLDGFAWVVGAEAGLASKPAPDPILRACKQLQLSPAECLMIGDSRFDQQAAMAAGCPFLGYRMTLDNRVQNLSEVVDLVEAEPTH
jgi:phosphoglycolate phosphatase